PDHVAAARAAAERGGLRARVGKTAIEGHLGEEVADRDPDAGGGGGELALGDADIGPPAQEPRRITDRADLRQLRKLPRRSQQVIERVGLATREHRQAVNGARDLSLERSDRREGGGKLRSRAGGVELGAAPGLESRFCELQGLALVVDVAPRDCKLRLRAPELEVRARHLRGHRHLRIAQGGFRALSLGALRLDSAAHAAEEIELPEGIEARVVEARVERPTRRAVDGSETLIGVAARGGDRGREIEACLAPYCARFHEPSEGDAQVVVRPERLIDEPVQRVITELGPELRLRVRAGVRAALGARELRRGWRSGLLVVRAHRAAGEPRGEGEERDRYPESRGRRAALQLAVSHEEAPGPGGGPVSRLRCTAPSRPRHAATRAARTRRTRE